MNKSGVIAKLWPRKSAEKYIPSIAPVSDLAVPLVLPALTGHTMTTEINPLPSGH